MWKITSVVKFKGTYYIKGLLCESQLQHWLLFKVIKKKRKKLGYHEEKIGDHADSKTNPKLQLIYPFMAGIPILRNSKQIGCSTEYSEFRISWGKIQL